MEYSIDNQVIVVEEFSQTLQIGTNAELFFESEIRELLKIGTQLEYNINENLLIIENENYQLKAYIDEKNN